LIIFRWVFRLKTRVNIHFIQNQPKKYKLENIAPKIGQKEAKIILRSLN